MKLFESNKGFSQFLKDPIFQVNLEHIDLYPYSSQHKPFKSRLLLKGSVSPFSASATYYFSAFFPAFVLLDLLGELVLLVDPAENQSYTVQEHSKRRGRV